MEAPHRPSYVTQRHDIRGANRSCLAKKDEGFLSPLGLADDTCLRTRRQSLGEVCRAAAIVLIWDGIQRFDLASAALLVPDSNLQK